MESPITETLTIRPYYRYIISHSKVRLDMFLDTEGWKSFFKVGLKIWKNQRLNIIYQQKYEV